MEGKVRWTITCTNGTWTGEKKKCDDVDFGTIPCNWTATEHNLVTFYHDQEITENELEFPAGSELVN